MYETIKHSNLIYDVGMHKGEDTSYYLKKGFNVIAFEADPDLITYCKNIFRDEIKSERLKIIEGAIIESSMIEDDNKATKFYKNKGNSVWGTVLGDWAARNEHLGTLSDIIEVPVVNFSECLKSHGIPYYLKIDIEGMDTICLKALIPFKNKPDFISIESEIEKFDKLKKEFDLLIQLGYSKFQAINQADISSQREPINSKQGNCVDNTFPKGSSGPFGSDLKNKWKDKKQILNEYRLIFVGHILFGNYGILPKRYYFGRLISRILNTSVPGWHDTHAKHSSVNKED